MPPILKTASYEIFAEGSCAEDASKRVLGSRECDRELDFSPLNVSFEPDRDAMTSAVLEFTNIVVDKPSVRS